MVFDIFHFFIRIDTITCIELHFDGFLVGFYASPVPTKEEEVSLEGSPCSYFPWNQPTKEEEDEGDPLLFWTARYKKGVESTLQGVVLNGVKGLLGSW